VSVKINQYSAGLFVITQVKNPVTWKIHFLLHAVLVFLKILCKSALTHSWAKKIIKWFPCMHFYSTLKNRQWITILYCLINYSFYSKIDHFIIKRSKFFTIKRPHLKLKMLFFEQTVASLTFASTWYQSHKSFFSSSLMQKTIKMVPTPSE
jgi:hypothetical protein